MNMRNTKNTKAAPIAIPMMTCRDNIGSLTGVIVSEGEVVVLDGELVGDDEPAGKRIKHKAGWHTMYI